MAAAKNCPRSTESSGSGASGTVSRRCQVLRSDKSGETKDSQTVAVELAISIQVRTAANR